MHGSDCKAPRSYTLDIWNSNSGGVVVFLDHLTTERTFLIKKNATGKKA
jgi:hypothetical protein